MSLKMLVKVSKISNLSDARYCSGMGVEMLGFGVIPGHEAYMPPALFQEIRGWISGPKIVAELYGIADRDEVMRVIQTYAPDYFELTYPEYRLLKEVLSLPCIVYLPPGTTNMGLMDKDLNISFVLVDESTTCSQISSPYPVLIKISSPEKLNDKLAEACFRGFVLEGPKESRPGITHYDQLGGILEALEEPS